MKSIQESIIGRKSSEVEYKLHNPKLKDLQHLDVVKCANGNIYICIDPDTDRLVYSPGNVFDGYRIIHHTLSASKLGLQNFYQDLRCKNGAEYDIISVYRNILVNKEYPDFQTIWNILQEKMKFLV